MSTQSKFLEEIKKTVQHEMWSAMIMLPREEAPQAAPHDTDAEQEVLSALLCEHTTTEALKPLESRHFYSRFNQHLFALLATTEERDLQTLVDLLDARGPALEELTIIRDATPFAIAKTLRKHVTSIMERWLERELIRTMQTLDAELRIGAITHDGARSRLRQHFMEISG